MQYFNNKLGDIGFLLIKNMSNSGIFVRFYDDTSNTLIFKMDETICDTASYHFWCVFSRIHNLLNKRQIIQFWCKTRFLHRITTGTIFLYAQKPDKLQNEFMKHKGICLFQCKWMQGTIT